MRYWSAKCNNLNMRTLTATHQPQHIDRNNLNMRTFTATHQPQQFWICAIGVQNATHWRCAHEPQHINRNTLNMRTLNFTATIRIRAHLPHKMFDKTGDPTTARLLNPQECLRVGGPIVNVAEEPHWQHEPHNNTRGANTITHFWIWHG